jgi:hypothetical protein
MMPVLGSMVQNGKLAAWAFALLTQLNKVLFPTFGRPTIPHFNPMLFCPLVDKTGREGNLVPKGKRSIGSATSSLPPGKAMSIKLPPWLASCSRSIYIAPA